MAFRKIPKKFDMMEVAAELKNLLLYSGNFKAGVIERIAGEIGYATRTVYSVLDGAIVLSLDFLHAAVIATDGDPEVSRYLVPDGFCLSKCADQAVSDKLTLAEECLDDVPALAGFHAVLQNPRSTIADVKRARVEVDKELDENVFFFKEQHGGDR